jgi:hypothetical protein
MNCTHVWNYEQALAYLFPDLERTMRLTDFGVNTRPDGRMAFRTLLPLSPETLWDGPPAADGQMGCVLKLYREWQLSGDTEWLRGLWPQAKRALEWAWEPGAWDADRDGMMEGEQHNTYDVEFFGANTMVGTLYLGALKAAALMAEALGDDTAATRFREVYESGRRRYDATLWNGEYYEQQVRVVGVPPDAPSNEDWHPSPIKPGEAQPRYQYGPTRCSGSSSAAWWGSVTCSPGTAYARRCAPCSSTTGGGGWIRTPAASARTRSTTKRACCSAPGRGAAGRPTPSRTPTRCGPASSTRSPRT